MPTPLFALIVLSGAALYFMTPEERTRLARWAVGALKKGVHDVAHPATPTDPFSELLRTRTRWVVVTPLLVVLQVVTFVMMAAAPGSMGDPATAIEWGANYAPRTTNSEWSRLIVSTFVHGGLLHLLANVAGLVPVGMLLERAVGRVAFAAVYLGAGVFASLVSLWTMPPTSVSLGASGAVSGIYGLLLASLIWSLVQRPLVPVPLMAVKRIAAGAVPFLLFNAFTDHLTQGAELAGFGTGVVGGLLIARGVATEKPRLGRVAMLTAATASIAIAVALPLRGVTDFRPQIAQIGAIEAQTTTAYDAAVAEFKLGRLPAKRLAQVIDRTILPELRSLKKRLAEVKGVPREQAPLVEAADTYLALREQSWRRRAEGLLRSNLGMLREAERTERAALEAFHKLQPWL
jgi:membrane associated rhomboid family serine protease